MQVQLGGPLIDLLFVLSYLVKYMRNDLITVKCRYNAVFGVQEIDRVIAVTAL